MYLFLLIYAPFSSIHVLHHAGEWHSIINVASNTPSLCRKLVDTGWWKPYLLYGRSHGSLRTTHNRIGWAVVRRGTSLLKGLLHLWGQVWPFVLFVWRRMSPVCHEPWHLTPNNAELGSSSQSINARNSRVLSRYVYINNELALYVLKNNERLECNKRRIWN